MNEWYFAKGGKQNGPVPFEHLVELARRGELDPRNDLVWTSSMKDWTPAGQVQGIFTVAPSPATPQAPAPSPEPANPYSAPQSSWNQPAVVETVALGEIIHGSDPIDAVACIKRGFEITKRQFGMILGVGVVYFAIIFGVNMVVGFIQGGVGAVTSHGAGHSDQINATHLGVNIVTQIVSWVANTYLGLGLTRVGLNFVSGREVAVGQLFGEGHKLLRALGASILFMIMVFLGFLLLVFPGIYLALRYGQFMKAIVDKDLGVMDAFAYSSSITTNNRMNLFVYQLLAMLVMLAGMLAFCLGMIFTGPIVWLGGIVAYRWMQYGHQAAMDQPGTTVPMLAGR